ncbi:MAG: two-component system response regulator, partial [Janthinobacterium sp.]
FDALSMCRPYKPGWAVDDIIGHLKAGAGSHFDPWLAQLFVELMPQLLAIKEQFHDVETVA